MDSIIQSVLFFISIFSSSGHALRCYSYDTETDGPGIPQLQHAVTCHDLKTSCFTVTSIVNGEISHRKYSCATNFNSCNTVTDQTNATHLHVQNCCQGDLCNDGINLGQEFEIGKKYCYAAQCSGENCLDELQTVIDRDNLGTFCDQDGDMCYTQVRKVFNSEGGTETGQGVEFVTTQQEYMTGCSTTDYPCNPTTSHDVTITCCAEHLCNGVNYTEQQSTTQTDKPSTDEPKINRCYVVSCTGERKCLQEAIQSENYTLCLKPSYGCEAGMTKTGTDNVYTLGCSPSLCVPGYTRTHDKTVIGCCSEDQCFPKFHNLGPSSAAACLINSGPILLAVLKFAFKILIWATT